VTPNKALQTDKGNLSCLLHSQKPRQLAFAAELGRYMASSSNRRLAERCPPIALPDVFRGPDDYWAHELLGCMIET
jgi:hypothetical protein